MFIFLFSFILVTGIHDTFHGRRDRRSQNFFPGVVIILESNQKIYVLPDLFTHFPLNFKHISCKFRHLQFEINCKVWFNPLSNHLRKCHEICVFWRIFCLKNCGCGIYLTNIMYVSWLYLHMFPSKYLCTSRLMVKLAFLWTQDDISSPDRSSPL